MPQIRRIRKRKPRLPGRLEDELPVIDPVAVKARLTSSLARWTIPVICILLALAVALVFGQVLDHEFINLGDKTFVFGNPLVTSGLKSNAVAHVFTTVDHDTGGFYAPLTMLTHMAVWRFSNQLDDRAASNHHLVNLLLHGTTVILLFLTLRLITGAIGRSAFVAALFAIHPLQVESVAWVAQRGDVLSGLFFILGLGAYVRYVYRPWSVVRYSIVFILFVLGLLSHPAMVSFPFVLLLLDYWPLSRYNQPVFAGGDGPYRQDFPSVFLRLFTEKIPFFSASVIAFAATLHARSKIENSLDTFSFPIKINNALVSCLSYLGRVIYPSHLTVFYPEASEPKLFLEVAFAFLLIGGISATAFLFHKKLPYLFLGWFWFLGFLAPAVGWGEGGLFAGSDHFAYLALVGLYFIFAWGAWDLCRLLPWRGWVAAGAAGVTLFILIPVARTQCSYWHDGVALWNHALDITRKNYIAYDNLGNALVEKNGIDDAISDYTQALAIKPNDAEAEDDFGEALLQKGKLNDAVAEYQKALAIRPHFAEAYIDLGEALVQGGALDAAIGVYNKALEIRPDYADAHYNLGTALAQKGDLPSAIAQFEKALEIRPYYAEAHFNLGFSLALSADPHDPDKFRETISRAITQYGLALDLHPNYAEAQYCMGVAYYQTGDLDNAISHWEKALAIKPNYEEAHYNLGLALVQKGEIDEALAHYRKALEIGPNYAEIYNNIATALFHKKEFEEAIENYQKAVELNPNFLLAKNDLAWLLSTCPNPNLRNGKRAVALIEKDSQIPNGNTPFLLRTLAAAYAESGRYDDAVAAAKQALQSFDPKTNAPICKELEQEIKLYESHSPYHESP